MKEKQNDYFLNLLNNPTFSPQDFSYVGLSVDNTSIQNKDVYQNLDAIKQNPLFQTDGKFDQSKFDEVYNVAKSGYNVLSNIKANEDFTNSFKFFRGNITAPEHLKESGAEFKIEKVNNPLRQQEGFVSIGLKENPTMSVREIAQAQQVWDPETNSWKESPNETWFDNFINPKVLAQYDEDGTHEDPITGEIIEHKKGDKKLNANGTYYYESLNGRSPYGKEVLSGFDTLTADGSTLNSLDFFDSDDLDKSVPGSIARAVAQIAPAFIPGIGEIYIGLRVLNSMSELIPTFGKIMSFDSDNKLFSWMEGFNRATSFSTSDYTQGSQEAETEGHMWSMETGLKLVADVFTQLAEQRWLFKYGSAMLSGELKNPKLMTDPKAQQEWIEKYIQENSTNEKLAEVLRSSDPLTKQLTMQSVNYARGKKALMDKLEVAQKLGSKLSMAYMTGITTAGAYGEAKEAGASDIEAGLFTLGYTAAEFALLNSDLGKWILPELKSDKRHWQAIVKKLQEDTKMMPKDTPADKIKLYQKIFNIGKQIYHNDLGSNPVLGETFGSVLSNMLSEGVEETSEELLADLSKALFTAAYQLGGSKTDLHAFENVFDRYAMSFIGGTVGGGIAGGLPGYRAARYNNSMDGKQATRELVDIVQQGKAEEFLATADKMTLSDKTTKNKVDAQGNYEQGNENDNRDLDAKKQLRNLVYNIQDILKANGADMSRNELVNSLKGELRYAQLVNIAAQEGNSIWYYLNHYNELSTQLVSKTQELWALENPVQTDKQKREENEKSSKDDNIKEQIKQKKEEIKEIKDQLEAYKDGRMSDEFIQDALFEMISGISSFYVKTDPWRYAEEIENKAYNEIPVERRAELFKQYQEQKKNIANRELMHKARLVHIQNQEYLADMMENFNEDYFKNKDAVIRNIEEILFGEQSKINRDVEHASERVEQFLHIYDNVINPLLANIQRQLIVGLDTAKSKEVKERLDAIADMKGSVAEILGRDIMPTVEELKQMSGEDRKKIVDTILGWSQDPGMNISSLTEDNLDEYESELKQANRNLQIQKTQAFNKYLIEFLYDPEVKQVIINKLKNAKYLLPTTKQAFIDFFTSQLKVENEFGEQETIQLDPNIAKEYLDALNDIPSSPVDEFISNVVGTLRSQGIKIPQISGNISKLLSDLAKVANVESFNYDDDTEALINQALDILDLALVALESAKTTVTGDLTDLFGFNATINEIRENRKTKTRNSKATESTKSEPRKLALINSDIATLIQQDINRYRSELLMYKSVYASNTQSVLTSHDNTYKVESKYFYDRVKRFIGSTDIDDWEGVEELRSKLESSEISDIFTKIEENKELKITDEIKEQITEARTKYEKAIYEFFQKNKEKLNDIEWLKKLSKNIQPSRSESDWILNENEKGIPESDFVWYIASLAAANPESVLHEYKNSFSLNFAPIAGQEEAIRTAYAFILNPKIFENFAKAYNENLPVDTDGNVEPYLNINTFRSIFIEGLPGSGKSTATFTMLLRMLDQYHPDILKKLVLVSNSHENSQLLLNNLRKSTGLKLEGVQIFSKDEYFKKISDNYPDWEYDEFGNLKITRDDITYDEETGHVKYSKINPNPDGLDASLVIIDEATSLSQPDAELEETWLKAKGIYSIKAGDFDQLGVYGEYKTGKVDQKGNEQRAPIFQVGTNYIRTHKLGQVIRGNNEYKINNILKLRENKSKILDILTTDKPYTTLFDFSYYSDNSGFYGDSVQSTYNDEIPQNTKDTIKLMLDTLEDGEKLNYIYDNVGSPLYKYLSNLNSSGEYSGKINIITAGASQSQEGQYYVVDLQLNKTGPGEQQTLQAQRQIAALYTAISRAKQGTLIFDRTESTVSQLISSTRMDKLVNKKMSQDSITNYGNKRKEILEKVLGNYEKTPEPQWKPITKATNTPNTEEPNNDKNEGHESESDEEVDIKNATVKEIDIKNEKDGELNMMLHTVMVQETGCELSDNNLDPTDPNNKLKLSPNSDKRIDNINGLIKIDSLGIKPESDGTLSQENKEKALKILGLIRSSASYRTNKSDIVEDIAQALGIDDTSRVKVNFIYKNSYKLDTVNSSGFMKFFKSVKEKLLGIFNKDGNREKLTTPHRQTIGVEIFIDDKQVLEVPVAMMTSPLTMLNTQGFEDLKQVFIDECGESLNKFKEWLWNHYNDSSAPLHTKSMYKLVELYSNYSNFVVRFDNDFTLNSGKITGIIHAQTRGEEYFFTHDYDYKGQPVSLEEYRKRMSWRNISEIRANNSKSDIVVNGQVIAKSGDPFVLISDAPELKNASFETLMEQFIKQAENSDEPKKVKRMYLYTPEGTIEDFLYNMDRAVSKKGEDFSTEEIDSLLGNKLSAYRLLSFIATDGSEFDSHFDEWMDGIKDANKEDIEKSKNRWKQLKELVQEIKSAEERFNINNGTKANQLLSLLDKPIENLPKEIKDKAAAINWPTKLKYGTPLRTVLQYEFRKLLYSGSVYGPALGRQIVDISLSRDPSGKVIFKDFQQPKIEALIKDATNNKYTGIQYYVPLANASENISVKGHTFAKVNAEDDTKISKRSFEINGKLETTAVVRDVEPILDEIIKKGIPNPSSTEGRSRLNNFSDQEKAKLYRENTKAYLDGKLTTKEKTQTDIFNEALMGAIKFDSNISNKDQNLIKTNIIVQQGNPNPTNVQKYLYDKLSQLGFYPIKTQNGYIIRKVNNIKKSLILSEKEIIFLTNDGELGILTETNSESISNPDILQSIINNPSTDSEIKQIAQQKLNSLNNPHNEKIIIPEQLLGLYEDTIQELEGGILEDQGVLNIISEVKNNNGNPEQSLNIIKLLKYIYTERNPNSIEDIEDSGSLSSYLFTNGIEATSVDVEQLAKAVGDWIDTNENSCSYTIPVAPF